MDGAAPVRHGIDFDLDGKQVAAIGLSGAMDNEGRPVEIPIAVFKNGAGPSLLLNGGTHGDEFEGPVALSKLIGALNPAEIRGRVIVLPALNPPALAAGTRCSPVDGLDLNRSFPGSATGTTTERIAHFVCSEILPQVEAVIDLHAGGAVYSIIPCATMHPVPDAEQAARTLAVLEAFGAPLSVIMNEPDRSAMLDTVVEEAGKIFVCAELGSGADLSPETIRITEAGLRNVLKHFGILSGAPVRHVWSIEPETRLVAIPGEDCFPKADADGIYEPFREIGERVDAQQPLGQIHSPERADCRPSLIRSPVSGLLLGRRAFGRVAPRDVVGIVARPATADRILEFYAVA